MEQFGSAFEGYMKRLFLILMFFIFSSSTFAQNSITVTISVTDAGGQTWNNGTYIANFIGPASVTWPGGTVTRSFSGSLGPTGTATQSLANNNTINPSPTFWTFTVCPAVGVSSGCFTTASISVTTPSQAVSITPPAISIAASSTNSPIGAYADAEITSNAFVGAVYYNVTIQTQKTCQAVIGNACATWGAGGINLGPTMFTVAGKFDAKYVLDASWSNGSSTITCPNNDCNFNVLVDNGKDCYGNDTLTGNNQVPRGTLTVITAQSATCSTATGNPTGGGQFAWCTNDDAAWVSAWGQVMASQGPAGIYAPNGGTCITKNPMLDTRTAINWLPVFVSGGLTQFFPEAAAFDFTTCSGPNNGCIWDPKQTGASQANLPQYSKLSNIAVQGLNFNVCGASASGKSAIVLRRVEGNNFWIWNWCQGAGGFTGANVISPNSITNLDVQAGATGIAISGNSSNAMTWLTTSYCGSIVTQCLVVGANAILVSKGSFWLGCTTQCVVVSAGGTAYFDGDQMFGASGNQYVDVAGTAFLLNVNETASNNNGHAILTRATGKVYVHNSFISETGTSGIAFNVNLTPGGSIINQGGNTLVGTDQTALTTAMVVPSAGWGTTATVTAPSGSPSSNPTRFAFTVNSSGTGQAANPTLALTYPNVGSTPTWTCKQVGGTQAISQISGENTANTTTMTLTYNGTPVAGNNVVINCQGALVQ
jgi:hypothetical protein